MKMKLTIVVAMMALIPACTENQLAKQYGGTASVDFPAGTKLVSATWKNDDLWYLTRPAREGEKPETLTFQESSSFGLIEGKVIFKEK